MTILSQMNRMHMDALMLEEQQELAQAKLTMQLDQSLPPEPFVGIPPSIMLQSIAQKRLDHARSLKSKQCRLLKTYVGANKRSSLVQHLNGLERIDLEEMQIRLRHVGKFLLCRTISLPTAEVGISLGVMSPNGYAVMLGLYNFAIQPISAGLPSVQQLDEALPVGTLLAIKEPFIKMSAMSQTPLLRVDSPMDVTVIAPDDPMLRGIVWRESLCSAKEWRVPKTPIRSVDHWRTLGNAFYQRGHYYSALGPYSTGLRQHPAAAVLHLNRAAAYLNLEKHQSALEDACCALALFMKSKGEREEKLLQKAMYRKACALYGLRRWKNAQESLVELQSSFPHCSDVVPLLRDVDRRLHEQSTGEYDMMALYSHQTKGRMDLADHIGPIQVAQMDDKGGGRGITTTRDVAAGEILMATKAWAAVFPHDIPSQVVILGLNLMTDRIDTTCQVLLMTELLYRLQDRSELVHQVTELYGGPDAVAPPSVSYDLHGSSRSTEKSEAIDIGQLEAILGCNAFTPQQVKQASYHQSGEEESVAWQPCALFAQASLFNHSCDYNASWTCFGDFQIIRAVTAIPAGSEALISYVGNFSLAKRTDRLVHLFREPCFVCRCALCEADRSDGVANRKQRDQLIDELTRVRQASPVSYTSSVTCVRKRLEYIEELIEKLEATYRPDRHAIRPALSTAYNALAFVAGVQAVVEHNASHYVKSIAAGKRELVESGAVLRDPPALPSGKPEGAEGCKELQVSPKKQRRQKNKKKHGGTRLEPRQKVPELPISVVPKHLVTAPAVALQIAAGYRSLNGGKVHDDARAWVRAAFWMDFVVMGSDLAMFKARYGTMLHDLHLPCRKSLLGSDGDPIIQDEVKQ